MATIERATYFLANLQDEPGAVLKVLQDFKEKDIGLSGLLGFGTSEGKAQLCIVGKNPRKVRNAWKKSGLLADEGIGFWVKGVDRTGALLKPLEALANAGINIVAIDATAVGGRFGSFIRVDKADVEKAAKALGLK